MKVIKIISKCIFWVLILALLLSPLALIYELSNREMEQYKMPDPPQFVQTSYGTVVQAERRDMAETESVSGKFISQGFAYQELDYKTPSKIRWTVKVGSEVQEGQVLGTYEGNEILSQYTGILRATNAYGDEPYLEVELLSPLVMECYVSQKTLRTLQRAKELTTADGDAVSIQYVSVIPNAGGNVRILLSIDSDYYYYGETVENLVLKTGYQYLSALVLPKNALYQKVQGEDEPWYVYKVDASGKAIGETEVTVGYSDGSFVCVSGIEAGEWFDTGYGAIKGGN